MSRTITIRYNVLLLLLGTQCHSLVFIGVCGGASWDNINLSIKICLQNFKIEKIVFRIFQSVLQTLY